MKALYPALITLAIILPLPIHAQLEVGRPAASNVPGRQYPYIHSDRRVTFRVKAPEAKRVQVVGRSGKNVFSKQPIDLIRSEDGMWMVTTCDSFSLNLKGEDGWLWLSNPILGRVRTFVLNQRQLTIHVGEPSSQAIAKKARGTGKD